MRLMLDRVVYGVALLLIFFFNDTATTEIYTYWHTLSLHDALPISALSGYMVASALGMAAGGFLVSATPRTERTITVALILAGLTLVVLALGLVPAGLAAAVVGLAGFCSGVAAPSRDLLIRPVTPKIRRATWQASVCQYE